MYVNDVGVVVLERRDCTCQDGTVPNFVETLCPECNGTGKNRQDKRKYCRRCRRYTRSGYRSIGYIEAQDPNEPTRTCRLCDGNYKNALPETYTDYTTLHLNLPWRVVRNVNREQSWAEQYLGYGLGSCVDYGRHKTVSDDELIEKEKSSHKQTQLCKIVRSKEDLRICDEIRIITADSGYSVVAYYKED